MLTEQREYDHGEHDGNGTSLLPGLNCKPVQNGERSVRSPFFYKVSFGGEQQAFAADRFLFFVRLVCLYPACYDFNKGSGMKI